MVVDPTHWGQKIRERPPPRWLDALQAAVISGEQVTLGYVSPKGETSTRVVHPLGIAAKGVPWYLVADTDAGMRTFRIDRVSTVEGTGKPVVRPEGFDLASAWKLIAERVEQYGEASVRALADSTVLGPLRWVFGARLRVGPAGVDGRVEVEIGARDQRELVARLAGFGAQLEVIEPAELRAELGRVGAELAALYGADSAS